MLDRICGQIGTGCIALVLGFANAPASAADPVRFAPHRAVYDIELSKVSPGSGIAGLTGRMVYELKGSTCEGYAQSMRFVTRMTNQEGVETVNDLRTTSQENDTGTKFDFNTTQLQNNKISEASQGSATRDAKTDDIRVNLVKPAKKSLDLPDGTYFPIRHGATMIETAKRGGKLVSANIFDGSEKGEKYYVTTAVIGKKVERGAVKATVAMSGLDRLAEFESWPISISYFEPGKDNEDSLPAYELSFRYSENGVTSNLGIDYDEFGIKGTLKELTFLDAVPCAGSAH